MKKCEYCGSDNPDDAVFCGKCGAIFPAPIPISDAEAQREIPKKKLWLFRSLIAAGVWIVISQISLYVAWHQTQRSFAWVDQEQTRRELTGMSNDIAEYNERYGTMPASFQDLLKLTNDASDFNSWYFHGFFDGWGHSLIFYNGGTNCFIMSYGRDGRPGGAGIDCDVTTKNPDPKEAAATYPQFLENKLCQGMITWSYICGGMAGLLSLLTVRIPNLRPRGIIILLLSLGATIVGTFFTTTVITAVHIPSGH
ncbi:MAG TPA: type II secretion system protein GspG [Verrucomicrobiae bacterium]|jgi:hypothetical protein|nr:type II secretion system protein GspG [Verrucomicrobiae bacterium]